MEMLNTSSTAVDGQSRNIAKQRHNRRIFIRTALMAWSLVVFTALVFLLVTIPAQRRQLLEEMRQRAKVAYTSTLQVAIESVVLEDYSGIVEHCFTMVSQNPGLKYVVLTREDGFSLIHTPSTWQEEYLDGLWKPANLTDGSPGEFLEHEYSEGQAFHLSYPFKYSGINWGWIHLGLSPEQYFTELRHIYSRTFVVALCAVIGGLVAAFLFARSLSIPIQRLDRFARKVGEGDLSQRISIQTGDEVQSLAESFNHMVEELNRSNMELVKAARQAGMAEMAVNVLHNVGNVLNSVGITTQTLKRRMQHSRMVSMQPLIDLMEIKGENLPDFIQNDPQGQNFPAYLGALSDHLVEEHSAISGDLDDLARHIQHLQDIVHLQQQYSRTVGMTEQVRVETVIDDAIAFNMGALKRYGIRINKNHDAIPRVVLDRQKLLQILTNLISNAKQALENSSVELPKITINTELLRDQQLRILVSDNGVGITEENLTRIFQHGFTTREKGHGFGLHSSALSASEMGGTLTAQSEGPGLGATFTLVLPTRVLETTDGTE